MLYESLGLAGYHIEPLEKQFKKLSDICAQTANQKALKYLISDIDGQDVTFNIASNDGQSSSMLEFEQHSLAYPDVSFSDKCIIKTTTLDSLVASKILPEDINILLIDAQGAEGLILKGAGNFLALKSLEAIVVETSHSPLYKGEIKFNDLCSTMEEYGFFLRNANFVQEGLVQCPFYA